MSHLTPERPHAKQHLSYVALHPETPSHPMITRSHSRVGSVGTISDSGSPPAESRRAARSTTLTSPMPPCDFSSSDADTKDFARKWDDSDPFREVKAKAPSLAQLKDASQHLITITNIIILFLLPFLALVGVWYILTSIDVLPQSISAVNSPFYYEFQRLARPLYPSDPLRYTLQ